MPTFFTGSSKLVRATTSATLHTIATTDNATGVVNLRNDAAAHAFAVLDDASGSLPDRQVVIPPGKSVKLARGTRETTLKITNASVLATPGYLRKNDKYRDFTNLSNAENNIRQLELVTGRRIPLVLSLDFDDRSAVVRDYRPANNYIGDVNGLLSYLSPSTKNIVGTNGFYYSGDTIRTELDRFGNSLGARIEAGATNLNLQSTNFKSATWNTSSTVTITGSKSILSGQEAYSCVSEVGALNVDSRSQNNTLSVSTNYTLSLIVEQLTADRVEMRVHNNSWFFHVRYHFNGDVLVNSGLGVLSSGVENLGIGPNGGKLVRIWVTGITDSVITSYVTIIYYRGVQAVDNVGNILHHAQLETGLFPSSPIITTTAAVARALDDIRLSSTKFPLGASFTLAVEGESESPLTAPTRYFMHYGASGNSAYLFASTNDVTARCDVGSVGQLVMTSNNLLVAPSQRTRIAASFATDNGRATFNGGSIITDTGGNVPAITGDLIIGQFASAPINGHIKRVLILPNADLSDEELQSIFA